MSTPRRRTAAAIRRLERSNRVPVANSAGIAKVSIVTAGLIILTFLAAPVAVLGISLKVILALWCVVVIGAQFV